MVLSCAERLRHIFTFPHGAQIVSVGGKDNVRSLSDGMDSKKRIYSGCRIT